MRLFASLCLSSVIAVMGCDDTGSDEGTFPCGQHGGRCETGAELCVVADDCSSCVPLEAPCAAADGCDCIDGVDHTAWDTPCADAPACEPSGDGLLVRCAPDGWGCG